MIESEPKVEDLRVIQKVYGVCFVTYILTILSMTLFCKQKEFNSEFFFFLYLNTILDNCVVNGIKFHLWLNAYFVKELH